MVADNRALGAPPNGALHEAGGIDTPARSTIADSVVSGNTVDSRPTTDRGAPSGVAGGIEIDG